MKRLLAAGFAVVLGVGVGAGGLAAPAGALGTTATALAQEGPLTKAQRTAASRAAKRAVPGARVIEIHREREHRSGMFCVELRKANSGYDVDLNRGFKVIEIDRLSPDAEGEYDD